MSLCHDELVGRAFRSGYSTAFVSSVCKPLHIAINMFLFSPLQYRKCIEWRHHCIAWSWLVNPSVYTFLMNAYVTNSKKVKSILIFSAQCKEHLRKMEILGFILCVFLCVCACACMHELGQKVSKVWTPAGWSSLRRHTGPQRVYPTSLWLLGLSDFHNLFSFHTLFFWL